MEPKGYMPYFEEPHIMAEIDIRGRFMMMACDIEWSILNIIMYSTTNPKNHHRLNQFKGMMMHEKIECAICDLKKYHLDFYIEYKEHIDSLVEFKEIRNDMSHHRLDFEDDTLKSFKMPYIDEQNGELRILWKRYTLEQMKDSVSRFRKANLKLMELVSKLYEQYNSTKTIQQTIN
jgi:hypothetical protein